MTAFTGAIELGYRHLETDLRLTSDGVLVCFHDDTVDRTTNGRGPVVSLTLSELKALDAGHRHLTPDGYGFRGRGVEVPTLQELVTTFPDVSVVVDLKGEGLAKPLARLVAELGLADRLIVGSFSERRLAEFRELTGGRVPTSSGPITSRAWLLAARAGRGVRGPASALQLPARSRGMRVVDERLVVSAHGHGLQVHVWTVNTAPEMAHLLDMGADGLITDRPDILRKVLDDRGEWRR